ncbi:MAG: hypothetical protein IJH37_05655 [Clostridia bacterium]|nr:hypothetical protein [Clostridia bacterium]
MQVIRCVMHRDCFGNIDGRCICLKDNRFKKKACPFYKDKKQFDEERRASEARLIDIDRRDLIEEYSGRNVYAQK